MADPKVFRVELSLNWSPAIKQGGYRIARNAPRTTIKEAPPTAVHNEIVRGVPSTADDSLRQVMRVAPSSGLAYASQIVIF